MQTKIIELKQAPVILVELPQGCKHEKLLGKSGDVTFLLWGSTNSFDEDTRPHGQILIDTEPRNRWRILGILSDLTEGQFAECVDKVNFESGPVYKNYKTFKGLGKASEAFDTLLESEKVYMDNPYEHLKEGMTFAEECENKWQEAQSRTIDPERTVVLVRKEVKK